jgi:Phage protein Gp138 N-terminal domain
LDRRERLKAKSQNALRVAIQAALNDNQAGVWTALPAIVEAFNPEAVTVSAQPTIQAQIRQPDGTWVDTTLPLCVDCPIMYPGGGGFALTFPLAKGNEGVLVFASRCIDAWWQQGGVQKQAELRMHDLSDGFFFPSGGMSQPNIIGAIDAVNVQLRNAAGTTAVTLTPAGGATVQGSATATLEAPAAHVTGSATASVSGPAVTVSGGASATIAAPAIVMNGNVSGANNLALGRSAPLSMFNVLPGNSANVNYTNLLNAIDATRSAEVSLVCEEGFYDIDGTIDLAYFGSSFIPLGPRVTFRHQGVGRFFTFNGSAFNPTGGVNEAVFGTRDYPIRLIGNPAGGTTDLMYVNAFNNSKLHMRGRDAGVIFRLDGVGQLGNVGAVDSEFSVIANPDADQLPYVVPPSYGALVTNATDCQFFLNLEECGLGAVPAAYFDASNGCNIVGGSIESNVDAGLFMTATCSRNVVDSLDNEFNGNSDYIIHGDHNEFRGVAAAGGAVRSQVFGDYNRFSMSDLWGFNVVSGQSNQFSMNKDMATNGGFTDTGTGTVVYNCAGIANKNWP